MFADAVEIASAFTFPYVGLRARPDGTVDSVVASFMVLNADGWIATSAHVIEEIVASGGLTREDVGAPAVRAGDVAGHVEIWALPGFDSTRPRLSRGRVSPVADIAIGRIEPFHPDVVLRYPVLRNTVTRPIRPGESVCRLGFPFHRVAAEYEAQRNDFRLAPDAFPAPLFALDGIVSRFNRVAGPHGQALFIETSTPGLRGQSGGPLLDVEGRVTGIQSRTAHLDLGFDAHYAAGSAEEGTERQFLNVGMASHVDELVRMLEMDGVSFVRG